MSDPFTITVSWAELAFLGTTFFAAGAYVCHQIGDFGSVSHKEDAFHHMPPRQGEPFEE